MLASLLRPDSGSIRIVGFDPTVDTAAVRSRVGWMPDLLGSWNSLSVRATLETTARLYRIDKLAASARATELITPVGLDALASQPTRVLSRGQKQRLSLARALVHDPAVLVLDEPASGLDPQARIELRQLVRRVASEGKTVLISSHVLAELDEMADGAVYLQAGVTASAERLNRTRSTARPGRRYSRDDQQPSALRLLLGLPGRQSVHPFGGCCTGPDSTEIACRLRRMQPRLPQRHPVTVGREGDLVDRGRLARRPADPTRACCRRDRGGVGAHKNPRRASESRQSNRLSRSADRTSWRLAPFHPSHPEPPRPVCVASRTRRRRSRLPPPRRRHTRRMPQRRHSARSCRFLRARR